MMIKVSPEISVIPRSIALHATQSGNQYYRIAYYVGNMCIHNYDAGCHKSEPSPIDCLDFESKESPIRHYNMDAAPSNAITGSINGVDAWWSPVKRTNRDAIIAKFALLVA